MTFFCVANAGFLCLATRPLAHVCWTLRYPVPLSDFSVLNIFDKSVPLRNELDMQLKHPLAGQVNPECYRNEIYSELR